MKTVPANLTVAYASGGTHLATAMRVTRPDLEVFGLTSAVDSETIGGVLYESAPGLDATSVVISSGASVGNLEITILQSITIFTAAQVLGGLWRNSGFVLFRYDTELLNGEEDVLLTGTIGEVELRQSSIVLELRDLRQYFQQEVGRPSSKTCPWRLESTTRANGGLCKKDISAAPFTMPFTVTSVTSNQEFRDSARAEALDWFGAGYVAWLTGNNAGLSAKVAEYAVNGTFTLSLPMFQTIQVGDTGTAVVGCRKRHERTAANPGGVSDCVDKFNNILNNGSQPHRPAIDFITKGPGLNV